MDQDHEQLGRQVSLRLPRALEAEVRAEAARLGVGVATLIKMVLTAWSRERRGAR